MAVKLAAPTSNYKAWYVCNNHLNARNANHLFCSLFWSSVVLLFLIFQPKTYIPGQHGESRSLVLELKIIADVGLVGFPNVRHVYLSDFIGYKVFAHHYFYLMISDLT